MIKVGSREFKSKKEWKADLQSLLRSTTWHVEFQGETLDYLIETMRRHPTQGHLADEVEALWVGAGDYGTHCFWFRLRNGTSDRISLYKSVEQPNDLGQGFDRKAVTTAFRHAIQGQADAVKRAQDGASCPSCGASSMRYATMHVDHAGEGFAGLLRGFLLEARIQLEGVRVEQPVAGRHTLSDQGMAKRWEEYHADRAELVAMCADCHRGKDGAQIRPLDETMLQGSTALKQLRTSKSLVDLSELIPM